MDLDVVLVVLFFGEYIIVYLWNNIKGVEKNKMNVNSDIQLLDFVNYSLGLFVGNFVLLVVEKK